MKGAGAEFSLFVSTLFDKGNSETIKLNDINIFFIYKIIT